MGCIVGPAAGWTKEAHCLPTIASTRVEAGDPPRALRLAVRRRLEVARRRRSVRVADRERRAEFVRRRRAGICGGAVDGVSTDREAKGNRELDYRPDI